MITYYCIRLTLLVAARVSRRNGYRISTVVGLLSWVFNGPARKELGANLARVRGAGPAPHEERRLTLALFVNLAKDYYELMLPAVADAEAVLDSVRIEGLDRIHEARRAGRGAVAVPFHMTGFNLAVQGALRGDWGAWVVSEPLRPDRMRRMVDRFRSALGLRLIAAERSSPRAILRALRANDVVVIAGDRGVTGTGVPVRFFDAPAVLPAGPAVLALRSGAALIPALHHRLPDDRVRMELLPAIPYECTGDLDADVQRITQGIADVFERHIRAHPAQWVLAQSVWPSAVPSEGSVAVREPIPTDRVARTSRVYAAR